jgi:hypothetical protein
VIFSNCSDVVIVKGLFGKEEDMSYYEKLLKEYEACRTDQGQDFSFINLSFFQEKRWDFRHGRSPGEGAHVIAPGDDWKKKCPTFFL